SGVPGLRIGITIMTHGNEPCGLAVFRHLREAFARGELRSGSVAFVLNNVRAAEAYFKAVAIQNPADREVAKLKARFCDINMNRLPNNLARSSGYEALRALELAPIWKTFSVGLDLHSTRSFAPPMIVAVGSVPAPLYQGFPIDIVIRDIEKIQSGSPACAFYGATPDSPSFGIEAGQHEDPASFEIALACAKSLLGTFGMIKAPKAAPRIRMEYRTCGSLFFPDETYELVKPFKNFEEIVQDQPIAKGSAGVINASFAGHVFMTPPGTKTTSKLSDEVLFFSDPVVRVES
ncbi:MAG TPA: succinylglutamate desuccinylase/aspartoacylase family protein, partial [Candidatus Paceibacterota bacterium]|nr:succinylglutamate desuccinylase/aspartoacylase family protein [Candidatus Paceibacterota bacterium]